jgi:uncharacterized membrane protein
MSLHVVTQTLERAEWLDRPARAAQNLVTRAYEAAGPAGETVHAAFHGDWLGHSLHAATVVVPVGSWTTAVALDTLDSVRGTEELAKGSDTALTLGLVTALAAATAGWTDYHEVTDPHVRRIGAIHAGLNIATIGVMGASLVQRRRGSRKSGRALALFGFGVMLLSAYLGGAMTYEQQAGVGRRG